MSVSQREIKASSTPRKWNRGGETSNKQLRVRTTANAIDIRGQKVDSAESIVDRAISKALAIGTLWVIHGHGTGRLMDGVRAFLSHHERVEIILYAEQEDSSSFAPVTGSQMWRYICEQRRP